MPIVPNKPADKILFFKAHEEPFTTNAVAIGTTAAAVANLVTLTTTAEQKQVAQAAAQEAARTATGEYKDAVLAMAQAGAEIIKAVKAKAASVGGDSVFHFAQLPPPATPTPVGPPGTATNFKVQLVQNGALELTFKCPNPAGATGTVYQIARQIGAGAAAIIATIGAKKFVDATVPAGSTSVTYQITAIRSTLQGLPAQFTVKFGVGGGGEMTAAVVSTPRIAA